MPELQWRKPWLPAMKKWQRWAVSLWELPLVFFLPTGSGCTVLLAILPQVKQRYEDMLREMESFHAERGRWQEEQAAAQARLDGERRAFEADAARQVCLLR